MSTNPNTQEATDLETEIISTIKGVPASMPSGGGNAIWTAAIKRGLITLGKTRNYAVCAAGFPDECEREWLYDLVWYRNDPQNHLREIGLILESEWLRDDFDIRYDFEKLLVGKSPIKVMVFQDSNDNLSRLWSMLETGIRSFPTERANETYILAAFRNSVWDANRLDDVFQFKTIAA